jgi:hypothetical protein
VGDDRPKDDEVLLALALAADPRRERRVLPDRRSGLDRRKTAGAVSTNRRSIKERRRQARRKGEAAPAGLLRRALEALGSQARRR